MICVPSPRFRSGSLPLILLVRLLLPKGELAEAIFTRWNIGDLVLRWVLVRLGVGPFMLDVLDPEDRVICESKEGLKGICSL